MLPRHNAINSAGVHNKRAFPKTGMVSWVLMVTGTVVIPILPSLLHLLLVELGQQLLTQDVQLLHRFLRRAEGADDELGCARLYVAVDVFGNAVDGPTAVNSVK